MASSRILLVIGVAVVFVVTVWSLLPPPANESAEPDSGAPVPVPDHTPIEDEPTAAPEPPPAPLTREPEPIDDPAAVARIVVRVTDEKGRPLPDATGTLGRRLPMFVAKWPLYVEPGHTGWRADSEGVITGVLEEHPGMRKLVIWASGRRVTLVDLQDVQFGTQNDLGTVAIGRAAQLRVEVVNEAGQPLSGVSVLITEPEPGGQCPCCEKRTQTDASGLIVFPGLAPGTYAIRARSDDHLPGTVTGLRLEAGATETVRVQLAAGHAYAGRVLFDTGDPAEDATVLVFSDGAIRSVSTDEGGDFEIAGLGDFPWEIEVRFGADHIKVAVDSEADLPQEYTLALGATLEIRPIPDDGSPIGDGWSNRFRLTTDDHRWNRRAARVVDGVIVIENLIPGRSKVELEYPIGFLPADEPVWVNLEAGETTHIELEMRRNPEWVTHDVVLEVTDEEGRPLAGAEVTHEWPSPRTDARGEVTLSLKPDDGFTVLARGHVKVRIEQALSRADGGRLEVRMRRGVTVVLSPEGARSNWVTISLMVPNERWAFSSKWREEQWTVIDGVEPGRYELHFWDSAVNSLRTSQEVVVDDRERQEITVSFPPVTTVTGTVFVNGEPAEGDVLKARHEESRFTAAVPVGANGQFRFDTYAFGEYRFELITEQTPLDLVQTQEIEEDQELHLSWETDEHELRGRFVDGRNQPLANCELSVFRKVSHRCTTDEYGRFSVPGVVPGRCLWTLDDGPENIFTRGDFEFRAGEEVTIRGLRSRLVLFERLDDIGDEYMSVHFLDRDLRWQRTLFTRSREQAGLVPEFVTECWAQYGDDAELARIPIDVTQEEQAVEFGFETGAWIHAGVDLEQLPRARGQLLELSRVDAGDPPPVDQLRVQPHRVSFPLLDTGRYQVRLFLPDGRELLREVAVTAGGNHVVELP